MKLKIFATIALLAVTPSMFATDWSHTYGQNQSITITIGTAYNYTISMVRQAGGYTQTFPAVRGKGVTQSFTVGPGTITLHVKYSDVGPSRILHSLIVPDLP